MEKLFENEDFILSSTGHDYDFVGIIETKGDEPLTFFFSEEMIPILGEDEEFDPEAYYDEFAPDENETRLLDVYKGLHPYNWDIDAKHYDDEDEEQETAERIGADSFFRTRDDKSTGFLSDPRERGQFLALVKNYCPEKLDSLTWVENGKSIV